MMAFSPGWLENESIWLHMSYKWYLELLRAGLYEQFFKEIVQRVVCFMDTDVFGRSPLEAPHTWGRSAHQPGALPALTRLGHPPARGPAGSHPPWALLVVSGRPRRSSSYRFDAPRCVGASRRGGLSASCVVRRGLQRLVRACVARIIRSVDATSFSLLRLDAVPRVAAGS